jgi:hypothetical protein
MKIVIATDGSDYSKAAVNSVAERPWLHFALVAPDGVPFLSAARRLVNGVGNRRLPTLTRFRRKQTAGRVKFLSDWGI